ncbi:uncharacterized protein LOC144159687 [Haemaphysalis longicornis]
MLYAAVVQPLVLLACLGIAVARPSSFNRGAEPSRLDVFAPDTTAASQPHSYTTDANVFEELGSQQPRDELAPAQGMYYHNVVDDLMSGSTDDYDVQGDYASADLFGPDPTYYPPAYAANRYTSSAVLQNLQQHSDEASRIAKRSLDSSPLEGTKRPAFLAHSNVPFTLGYTREEDWRPASTAASRYVPHRPVSSHELPPFTAVRH